MGQATPSTRDGTGRSGTTAGSGKTGPRITGLPVHHLPPEQSLDLRPRQLLHTPDGRGLRRPLLPGATPWMGGMANGVGPLLRHRRPGYEGDRERRGGVSEKMSRARVFGRGPGREVGSECSLLHQADRCLDPGDKGAQDPAGAPPLPGALW